MEVKKNTQEQAQKLNIDLVFKVDNETQEKLESFYNALKISFGEIIIDSNENSLPFHFTIIGGGKISYKDLEEFQNKKVGVIKDSLESLQMYNSEKHIPNVKSFDLSWHTYPYGEERLLILRIRLDYYVLSGDKDFNKKLATDLGNPNMDFTLPSHILICKFLLNKESNISFNEFLNQANEILKGFEIENIKLEPAVFIKRKGEDYQEIDLIWSCEIKSKSLF